ncbi:spore coat protein [Vulcanibacillus modesticaldus]|uniref:Spore coat protein n=1 Tax=Vulcanibacillus modesticaldus TaxID=337097 RepID=A0A1D2YWY7_9BACI|nr:outer spore coat protein CotE [Vulcanibacillus modesticaldus]OEG00180.1 spore coat protein [Vulcanibacillus modesticaldus]
MFHTDKDLQSREIITKAVCGKGRKFSKATHTISLPNKPNNILGSWAINHTFDAEKVGDVIEVIGTYDINIWYSYANNTKTTVETETISYVEQVPLSYLDGNCSKSNLEVIATATEAPTCTDAKISENGDSVIVEVEKEFLVEVIGETKVCVVISSHGCDDEEKGLLLEEADIDSDDSEDLDPSFIIDDLD